MNNYNFELQKLQKQIDRNRRTASQNKKESDKQISERVIAGGTSLDFTKTDTYSLKDMLLMESESGEYRKIEINKLIRGVDVYVQTEAPEKPKLHDIWIKI